MLRRAERFDELPAAQQAALRAQVTRTLNVVSDPDIEDVLIRIQDVIGTAAVRPNERMTIEDLTAEYTASYAGYDTRQRAAFKAKVSRLGNVAKSEGDDSTAVAAVDLMAQITHEEELAQRDLIRRLAGQLNKR
jgi:hypothetical protein